jgi:hypothetical protein
LGSSCTIGRGLFGAACLCALVLAASLGSGAPAADADGGCPNEAIREEQHSTFLPDCRAWEMVSPPNKNGADVVSQTTRTRAASDGNAVAYLSLTGFGDVRGGGVATEYIAVRDPTSPTGWSTHTITPGPLEPASFLDNTSALESHYTGEFSADLRHAIFLTKTPLTADSPYTLAVPKLYLFDDLIAPGPKVPQLISDCPACKAALSEDPTSQPGLAGTSSDFSHVIFESDQSLTDDVPHCEPLPFSEHNPCPLHLYEWSDGTVRLAGVLPDGSAAPNSQAGQGVMRASSTGNANRQYAFNVISEDGSRIFFTVRGGEAATDGNLYMRTGNSTATPWTVQLNASERTPPEASQDARYWTATPDGSRVLFTSSEQLTESEGSGLYMYDASKPASAPDNLTLLASGPIAGVIGMSEDASYVYYVTGSSPPKIMLWHQGNLREVAKVAGEDPADLVGAKGISVSPKMSRVTPDGRHMMFVSLGSDALPHSGAGDTCQANVAARCTEVYTYDAPANGGAGQLSCASCPHPAATPAHANAEIFSIRAKGATAFESHLNHPLTDDGSMVFFTSAEDLLPGDTNSVEDVYSYDTTTAQLFLLSSGVDPSPAIFLDASPDGRDVFFTTRAALSPWDQDGNVDLYDARVEGGVSGPPPAPADCGGPNSCRPPLNTPPNPPSIDTSELHGSSVGRRPRCRHRNHRKRGRCVRRGQHHRSKLADAKNRRVGR